MGSIRRIAWLIAAAPALLLVAAPLRAETPAAKELPKFFGIFSTKVGAWSEYAVTEAGGKKSTMRNAIVGKEGDAFWYEVAITEGGSRNIIKMALTGDPNNTENIQRLIMKNGDQPAQEMPREFVMMGRRMATHMFEARSGSSVADQPNLTVQDAGTDTVTVPAGTYKVSRNRILDAAGKVLATYDFSDAVLPLGVVRSETDKVRLELIATGMNAVSLITEQPTMMKTPPGMPEGNPRGRPPGMVPPQGGPPAAPASGGYGK